MNALDKQFARDRALRDAAWGLVRADITHLRADLEHRPLARRAADRAAHEAQKQFVQARKFVSENKAAVAIGALPLVLWFARKPILGGIAAMSARLRERRGKEAEDHPRQSCPDITQADITDKELMK